MITWQLTLLEMKLLHSLTSMYKGALRYLKLRYSATVSTSTLLDVWKIMLNRGEDGSLDVAVLVKEGGPEMASCADVYL